MVEVVEKGWSILLWTENSDTGKLCKTSLEKLNNMKIHTKDGLIILHGHRLEYLYSRSNFTVK